MIPVSFNVELTDSQKDEKNQLIQELMNDSYVRKLCLDHGISLERLQKSPWTVKRWIDGTKPCIECKGLSYCAQKNKGYVNSLVG